MPMSVSRNSTRQRLIDAALELFVAQGITETTTKQIAELAGVNEVTLFRQFSNKHGLLRAVIDEAAVFTHLGQALVQPTSQLHQLDQFDQALRAYAIAYLQALERVPQVVRSVVGEAGQYPAENRESLGRGFTQVNHYVAAYFETVISRGHLSPHLSAEKLAGLLNSMLLGYAVIEFTSEFHQLWQNREDFLENLVTLFLRGATSQMPESEPNVHQARPLATPTENVADLPASDVHTLLRRARKLGSQDYAILYVLFGAGLSAGELVQLERSHYINDDRQSLLQITQGNVRQVPLNQWILGKRYGSYTRNPLSQWLKSRKDHQSALFVNDAGNPLSEPELRQRWHQLTEEPLTGAGEPPTLEQAQQTWCIDMLMRGFDLEALCILTGWDTAKLQVYARRAREKAVLEQAARLDQKN